jgi:hypothetical protein
VVVEGAVSVGIELSRLRVLRSGESMSNAPLTVERGVDTQEILLLVLAAPVLEFRRGEPGGV